jgi:hypothetical protein
MSWLALTLQPRELAAKRAGTAQSVDAQSDTGELSDQELVEVAGGGYPGPGMSTLNFTFDNNTPLVAQQPTNASLMTLFGNSANTVGLVGLTGGWAIFGAIFGAGAFSTAAEAGSMAALGAGRAAFALLTCFRF